MNTDVLARRSTPTLSVVGCSALAGDAVVNRRGERIGRIEHIVIDVETGRIAFAVLACGGVFGLGERLHAVDWPALRHDAHRRRFVMDTDAVDLEGRDVV